MRYVIVMIFGIFFINCHNDKELYFVTFEFMNNKHSFRVPWGDGVDSLYKEDFYLMYNYKDNKDCEKKVEQFICNNRDSLYKKYIQYDMIFYKYSEECIEEYMKNCNCEFPENQDAIYSISWRSGGFSTFNKTIKQGDTKFLYFDRCN